jgi:hypothetical protein
MDEGTLLVYLSTGQCILFSVVFTPLPLHPPPPGHHGSVWVLPEAKSKVPDWGDKVDSGIGLRGRIWHSVVHVKCVGVDSGVNIRWGYSQLRHRVSYIHVSLWIRPLLSLYS